MAPFPADFYAQDTAQVARELLGSILIHETEADHLSGRIVEVEAYFGANDPGSHAFRGVTPRNAIMFGPPGHAYVYRSYGIHACLNVVTEPEGIAAAVLIRALEPLDGIVVMERNRGRRPLRELCNGPGKLCQALEIDLELNGVDLTSGSLRIEQGRPPNDIAVSGRIGLSVAGELPLRFYEASSQFVSRGKAQSVQPAST